MVTKEAFITSKILTGASCLFMLLCSFLSNAQPLTANAGAATAEVCEGDGFVLGGNPSVSGGSGFYNISWTSNPPGFTSSSSNPVVTPTETTTYTLFVVDSDGNTDSDAIVITVNERTDPSDLEIVLDPASNTYSVEDDPVDLSFTVSGGGSGSGVFSGDGVNSTNNKFYPNAASLGNNDIFLAFTNTDNCQTSVTKTVQVYDPNTFISGLEPSYCPEGFDDLVVNVPPPYLTFVNIFLYDASAQNIPDGTSWTKNLATRQVRIYLDQLPKGRNFFQITYTVTGIIGYTYTPYLDFTCLCIRFITTPIFGPVPANVFVPFVINEPPVANLGYKATDPEFCRNESPVDLEGSPIGGIWQGSGVTMLPGNDNNPAFSPGENGLATFNPATAALGVNTIRYIYQDGNGCRDTTEVDFTVYNVPTVNFAAVNGCVETAVEFNPSVTIPPGVTIDNYIWDFGDGTRDISPVLNDPTVYTYTSSGDFDVNFSASTPEGCVSTASRTIPIGSIPDVNLSWSQVCDGDPTRFSLQSSFFSSNPGNVSSITWDFGDGNIRVLNSPAPPDSIQFHTFSSTGNFQAEVIVESILGCVNTAAEPVYKVARTSPVNGDNEYFQHFNHDNFEDQQWVTGGLNSSWEWGVPANSLIDQDASGGGKAWVTNLTGTFNIQEKSWAHSPCIDLSRIERPVVSLDIRSLTRQQIEGAVLQINSTPTTNNESEWKTIGSTTTGVNWYNATGILSNPGNQALLQTGWSGALDPEAWRTCVIALDNVLAGIPLGSRDRVRFRIAFASLGDFAGTEEGFAFDNFRISQRDRVILLENFTNSGGVNTPAEENKVSNQTVNNFIDNAMGEVVKLEYHLSFSGPNADPLYHDNPADANARAAFYGATYTPLVMLDGEIGTDFQSIYSNQSLKTAGATIDTIFTIESPAETFNLEVTFTAKQDLPPNTALHIAVVEKEISEAAASGTNGESIFKFVMKKMLPTALGTVYSESIPEGESRTVNVSWPPQAYDINNLAVIAFVQNENTGEVYQSGILSNPIHIPPASVITGVEPTLGERLSLYPIPANEYLNIKLPVTYSQEVPMRLIDSFGKDVYLDSFKPGEQTKKIETSDLADGIYILQLEPRGSVPVRKKVMVVK